MDAKILIEYLQSLGYQGDKEGVCYGVTHTAMDYFFSDLVDEFNAQIHLFSNIKIDTLPTRIAEAREKNKLPVLENPEVNKINDDKSKINASKLTIDKLLLRLPPFFEAIELYQQAYKYPYLFPFGEAPLQQDALKTLPLIQSQAIEENGLTAMNPFSGIYDLKDLHIYFNNLVDCLEGFDDKVFLSLSSERHIIGVGYDSIKKVWFFIDANQLPIKEIVNLDILVKAVSTAFSSNKITAFTSTIYSKSKKINELNERIDTWKNIIKEIYIPNTDKARMITSEDEIWLFFAVRNTEISIIEKLLSIADTDINFLNNLNKNALFYGLKNKEIVQMLLEAKAHVNIQDYKKKTVLFYSLHYPETLEILLEHGADPNLADVNNETPLFFALSLPKEKAYKAVKLLLEFGANPNHQNKNGNTVLLESIFGDLNIIMALLEDGANPYIANKNGNSFLTEAIESRNLPIIEILSDRQGDEPFFIDLKKFINQEIKGMHLQSLFQKAIEFNKRNKTSIINSLLKNVIQSKAYKDILLRFVSNDKNSLDLVHFFIESIDTKLVPNNNILGFLNHILESLNFKKSKAEDKDICLLIIGLAKQNLAYRELSEKALHLAVNKGLFDEKTYYSSLKENINVFSTKTLFKYLKNDNDGLEVLYKFIESIDTRLAPNEKLWEDIDSLFKLFDRKQLKEDKKIYDLVINLAKKNPAYRELSKYALDLAFNKGFFNKEAYNIFLQTNIGIFSPSKIKKNDEPNSHSNHNISKDI